MEAIGEKLRSAREEQGRSIEEVARETNIAKRYIVALEEENFDAFPGEPYLIGFLRTYSETLGLSPDEIVALYKSFKIQEQPLPMDELIQKPKRKKWWLIPVIVVLLGGAGGGYFILSSNDGKPVVQREKKPEKAAAEKVEQDTGTVYEMKDEIIERRFLEGDTVQILVGEEEYPLRLKKIGKQLKLIGDAFGEVDLSVGEERSFDLNRDTKDDIKVFIRDIDTSAETPAAVVRFDKFTQANIAAGGENEAVEEPSIFLDEEEAEAEAAGPGAEVTETVPGIGSTAFSSREQRITTIFEQDQRRQFTMDFIFRGYCMLRYLTGENMREERYFHKGETFRLENVSSVRLWISNAGACKARIGGREVEFGRPGEVATKLIQWRQDDQTDSWRLTLEPVY